MYFKHDNIIFWLAIAAAITFAGGSPAVGLALGAFISLVFGNPAKSQTGKLSKKLLQLAVILLGFGLQLSVVLKVGYSSIGLTFFSITLTMLAGFLLGRIFSVDKDLSTLLSTGTAICGGSAIAAMSPAIGASQTHTALAMAIVFLLNGLGLIIFPHLGAFFEMSQTDFGIWSALAIHDTSSVVGAAAIYGAHALAVGTTVKLTRALWILPLSFAGAKLNKSESGAKVPWFLFGFLLAAVIRSYMPQLDELWTGLAVTGKKLMTATLFFVGAGLTRTDLRQIGVKPLIMAVILWIIVSVSSFFAINAGWINITF
jgi:uncharacterized integral membrane protein (TIGR00698 family)